jgi:hypothetical protein
VQAGAPPQNPAVQGQSAHLNVEAVVIINIEIKPRRRSLGREAAAIQPGAKSRTEGSKSSSGTSPLRAIRRSDGQRLGTPKLCGQARPLPRRTRALSARVQRFVACCCGSLAPIRRAEIASHAASGRQTLSSSAAWA